MLRVGKKSTLSAALRTGHACFGMRHAGRGATRDIARRDQDAQANPLGTGALSDETKVVLGRFDLQAAFEKEPANAIARLHEQALNDDRRDIRYALAEICFLYGDKLSRSFFRSNKKRATDYFLLSAVYAYLYLLDDMVEPPPTAFDQRFRTACDLYNFSLWRALSPGNSGSVEFRCPTGSAGRKPCHHA